MLTLIPAPPSCSCPCVVVCCVWGFSGAGLGGFWVPASVYSFARWTCHAPGVREDLLPGVAIFLLPSWQGRAVDPLQAQSAETFVRVIIRAIARFCLSVALGGW